MKKINNLKITIKNNFKLLLPLIYVLTLLAGLLLYLIYKIIPSFNITSCINLGGRDVCTLLGIYIYILASLPGYIILGNLLKFLPFEIPNAISFVILILINLLIYYVLGAGFQKLVKEKNDPSKFVYNITVFVLIFLIIVYLILSTM